VSIPPSARQRVVAEQLRLLTKSAFPLHVGTVTVLIAMFTVQADVPPLALGSWCALALSLQAIRYWTRWRIHGTQSDRRVAEKWRRPVTILLTAAGLQWGTFALLSGPILNVDTRIFVLFIVASMMTGGSVSFTAYMPACQGFVVGAAVPIATSFILYGQGATAWLMAGGTAAYLATLIVVSRGSNRSITKLIELTLENDALVRDLSSARDAAEQASRIKSQFLANMSHELRTPLNAIIGFSDIVRSQLFGPLDNLRYADYLSDIHRSGHHLLRLVNDILDISKLEAGAMEISDGVVDLRDVIADSINLLRPQAAANGVSLAIDVAAELPRLCADELRLKQVVVNLLSNAVKFSRRGGNVVLAAHLGASGDLVVAVRDSGIGMDDADIGIALQPFRQVEHALSRSHEGTGLGLPLAKALIEKHGGRLHLASERDVGTTVTLTLPASRLLAPETGAAPLRAAS
jgi:signal transduction histidine kinase